MFPLKPPTGMTPACGDCNSSKRPVTYTFQKKLGVQTQTHYICNRCDLTPDPPKVTS